MSDEKIEKTAEVKERKERVYDWTKYELVSVLVQENGFTPEQIIALTPAALAKLVTEENKDLVTKFFNKTRARMEESGLAFSTRGNQPFEPKAIISGVRDYLETLTEAPDLGESWTAPARKGRGPNKGGSKVKSLDELTASLLGITTPPAAKIIKPKKEKTGSPKAI